MRYYRTGKDDSWNRPIWKDANGQVFVDTNCGNSGKWATVHLHSVTDEGEPIEPIVEFPYFESYQGMKRRHEKEINAFPMGFAFNEKQFAESLEILGVTDPKKELTRIGGGGFIKKADKEYYHEMFDRIERELDKALENDSFLIEALRYELANTEYCYTGDPTDTLKRLGVSLDDERVKECFEIARQQYMKDSEGWM